MILQFTKILQFTLAKKAGMEKEVDKNGRGTKRETEICVCVFSCETFYLKTRLLLTLPEW